ITALTDLINNAVNDVIIEYAAVGHAVPSLDTLEPGPFQHLKDTPGRMTRVIQIIKAACAQLCSCIAPPGSIMINVCVTGIIGFECRNHWRYRR
ncbi:hypothetical protein F5879DRAFT_811013, partial [Lentinula edodes]